MRRSKQSLGDLLRDAPLPDGEGARERSWRLLGEAAAERPPPRSSRRLRPVLVAAAALVLVAAILTPAGAEVRDWIGDVIEPGRGKAEPSLTELPGGGSLLVASEQGIWVVHADGSKRLLGPYEDAGWSPHGLFVVASRGRELTALEPGGDIRWSLSSERHVSRPRWATTGFRVAYLSGDSLRVVAGDGTGDELFVGQVAPVAPAWAPPAPRRLKLDPSGFGLHRLAYADSSGRVVLADTDTHRVLWRTAEGPVPSQIEWLDRERLLVVSGRTVRVLGPGGEPASSRRFAGPVEDVAPRPGGGYAVSVRSGGPGAGETAVRLASVGRGSRHLFSGPGPISDLAWSPDGRLLLIGWSDADQWLFLPVLGPRPGPGVLAVDGIGRQFDPSGSGEAAFPRVESWCCPG